MREPETTPAEPDFGIDGCTCRPWTRQTNPPRYLDQPGDTIDMIGGWERGTDCPHHTPAPAPAAALRDDIAQALHAQLPGCTHDEHGHDCHALADAVLAVVQPILDRVQDACAAVTGQCRAAETRAEQAEGAVAPAVPTWAQRCSCGGQGIVHLHAGRHEPVGPAAVDPFDGRACPMCGDYATGPCPVCAPLAIAAVARARELHQPSSERRPLDLSLTPITHCTADGQDWPCPTIRALDTRADNTPED